MCEGMKNLLVLSAIIISGAIIATVEYRKTEKENVTKTVSEECNTSTSSKKSDNKQRYDIPDQNTDWYSYMDLSTITDPTTKQYEHKKYYWLDDQGLWRNGYDYVAAVASSYGDVGDRLRIITDTGNQYTVFIGDIKNNINTDSSNMYTTVYTDNGVFANVVEFIVNIDSLSEEVRYSGNVGKYPNLSGKITTIEKIQ